jgi:hypothetical protein
MGLFQWAAAAAAGYVIYRAVRTKNADGEAPAAFATGEAPGENFAKVRSAGSKACGPTRRSGTSRTRRWMKASRQRSARNLLIALR